MSAADPQTPEIAIPRVLPPLDVVTDAILQRVDALRRRTRIPENQLSLGAGLQRGFVSDRLRCGKGVTYTSLQRFSQHLTDLEDELAAAGEPA